MKVLFAVSNDSISEAIIKRYPKDYKELLSYKNVYYFNAILKEIQNDKSYDRIVISEDLEPFVNTNNDSIDNFIFNHLDRISDEAQGDDGKEISIILICSERRTFGGGILNKFFSIGIYNALIGKDRNLSELCKLIYRPRTKKEAKLYYRIDQAVYDPAGNTEEVSESEIQNILNHFKKLGKSTDRYADSFNNIAAQYTDDQLKVIVGVLPIKVKAVLEAESEKYQILMGTHGNPNKSASLNAAEPGIKINTIGKSSNINGRIVIPSGVRQFNSKTVGAKSQVSSTVKVPRSISQLHQQPEQPENLEEDLNNEISVDATENIAENKINQGPKVETPEVQANNIIEEEPLIDINDNNDETELPGFEEIEEDKKEDSLFDNLNVLDDDTDANEAIDANDDTEIEDVADNTDIDDIIDIADISETNNTTETTELTEKKGRGRPRKVVNEEDIKPKGKRGRPRKNVEDDNDDINSLLSSVNNVESDDIEIPGVEEDTEFDSALPGLEDDTDDSTLPGLDDDADDSELPGLEDDTDDSALPGLEDDTDDGALPGLDEDTTEEDGEEVDVSNLLAGLDDDSEDDNELPGLEDDTDDSALPGLEDDTDDSALPGLDDDADDSALPGLEDDSDDGLLPGLDDDADDSALPGLEDDSDDGLLPGLDDDADDSALPGLEDDSDDGLLPGLDDDENDSALPGLDDDTDDGALPGLDDDTTGDDLLPGLDNDSSDDALPGLDDSSDDGLLPGLDDDTTGDDLLPGLDNDLDNNVSSTIDQSTANELESIKPKIDYSMSNLNSLLSKDKKIVTFVGTTKNGTSFLVNNLALMFSLMGIDTAILDMTQNKNSYYIFTDSREELRNIAYTSISKLENGYAEGIKFNKNLTVYTSLPADGNSYENAEPILSTLIQNHSLVLIDCDFTTPPAYFASSQEIYLVQSMDILTIQPLTAFIRDLKVKGAWEPEKARVVINKETAVRVLNNKMIIGGMSRYNGPDMSVMTDLFNKDMVKACSIPFDEKVYSKYLETMATCKLSLNGYPKQFMSKLQILGDMVYPRLNNKKTYEPSPNGGYGNPGGNTFSNDTNNILNKMKNNY